MFGTLKKDISAVFKNDPAAKNIFEVLTYAGLHAVFWYRFAHFFYVRKARLFARLVSQSARFWTGIEIHPGATIGKGLFIDHGMGVVIGETAVIGDDCVLYHGVTLGGVSLSKTKRHPTLGNNVIVGTGAKILGNITLGDNVRVGANAVILKDVPPDTVVVGVPGRLVMQKEKDDSERLSHARNVDPEGEQLRCMVNKLEELEKRLKILESENNNSD
ncbi:MAG: serine O-acetyltransferase [Abditibacteriota bacterium]|nr:serine O-acetyltransferase [Abditibacteriota bacterium]